MSDLIDIAAAEGADDLTALAEGYPMLYELRTPGPGDGIRTPPGPKPPLAPHVVDVITSVERLARWADQAVAEWLNRPYVHYGTWWGGDPNPMVVQSLTAAARGLPEAAVYGGSGVLELAAWCRRTVTSVRGVLGPSGPSELAGECPVCHADSLVRLHHPERVLCAIGCTVSPEAS